MVKKGILMNLSDIILKTGAAIIKDVVPGGGVILDVVNELLPDDKKLPKTATGHDMQNAITALPAESQVAIMAKQFDVEIAEINGWSNIQASLSDADKAGASTRPFIAKSMSFVVGFAIVVFVLIFAYAVFKNSDTMIKTLNDSWPLMLAILATPTTLLRAYFGMRTKEKQTRYNLAAGHPAPTGGLGDLVKMFR